MMIQRFFFLLFLFFAAPAWTAPTSPPPVTAELVSDYTTVAPGTGFNVAVHLKMAEGWHTYWKNPGDTGLPTTVRWTLPRGVQVKSDLLFPAPEAQVFGAYMNYGYTGSVLLPTRFHISNPPAGKLTIRARVDWLMCADVCIPDGADLTLNLNSGTTAITDPLWAPQIAAVYADSAQPLANWRFDAAAVGQHITLRFTPLRPDVIYPDSLYFFADQERLIEPSLPQTNSRDGDTLILTLPVSYQYETGTRHTLSGIVRSEVPGLDKPFDFSINVPLVGEPQAGVAPRFTAPPKAQVPGMATALPPAPPMSLSLLLLTLLSALIGGVILNLMPCVFPVISIKALGLVRHHENRAALRREAWLFGIGVIVSFLMLGGLLTALRALGAELGWGFQLQSTPVVLLLTLLFFVMALNLSGVFEFGLLAPGAVTQWSPKKTSLSAFMSGVLAVVVASPCTAPFMGTALGVALTQPIPIILLIFAALGVGMALPYTLLAIFPTWQRWLPRPGVWMERLKQLLAFPLYATVAWLLWVIGAQAGNDVVLRITLTLTMLALAMWAYQHWRMAKNLEARGTSGWLILFIAAVTTVAVMLVPVLTTPTSAPGSALSEVWQPYNESEIKRLNDAGKTVFVDFTAAWCVTCQINKKLVLDTDTVQKAFAQHGVVLMRADWTRRDAVIADALARLGRNGVPVYMLKKPGAAPQLLPELLRQETVLTALGQIKPL